MRITPATETLRSAPERLVKPLVLQVTAIPGVFSILHKIQAHGGRYRRGPGPDPARMKGLCRGVFRHIVQIS